MAKTDKKMKNSRQTNNDQGNFFCVQQMRFFIRLFLEKFWSINQPTTNAHFYLNSNDQKSKPCANPSAWFLQNAIFKTSPQQPSAKKIISGNIIFGKIIDESNYFNN